LNRLNSAPAGQALAVRTQVAIEVLTTTEYRNRQITKDYITFLGRTPGSAEGDFWRGLIEQTGFTQEQVIASIMSSPATFLRPHLFPEAAAANRRLSQPTGPGPWAFWWADAAADPDSPLVR